MKFSTTLVSVFFGMTTHALALTSFLPTRANSPVTALEGAFSILSSATGGDVNAITGLVSNFPSDATAQLTVIANINVALGDIAHQIDIASHAVVVSTRNAVVTLNPVDVTAFIAVFGQIESVLNNIQVSTHNDLATLPPGNLAPLLILQQSLLTNRESDDLPAFGDGLAAIKLAIPTLANPLQTYALKVKRAVATTGGNVSGLQAVIKSLIDIVNDLLTSLGLGSVSWGAGGTLLGGVTGGVIGGSGGILSGVTGSVTGGSGGLLSGVRGGVAGGITGSVTGDITGSGGLLLGNGGFLGTGIHVNVDRRQVPGLPTLPITVPTLPTPLATLLAQVEALLAGVVAALKGTSVPGQAALLAEVEQSLEDTVEKLKTIPV